MKVRQLILISRNQVTHSWIKFGYNTKPKCYTNHIKRDQEFGSNNDPSSKKEDQDNCTPMEQCEQEATIFPQVLPEAPSITADVIEEVLADQVVTSPSVCAIVERGQIRAIQITPVLRAILTNYLRSSNIIEAPTGAIQDAINNILGGPCRIS